MVLNPHVVNGEIRVMCPEMETEATVRFARDDSGLLHVHSCSRFAGELLCRVPCEAQAIGAYLETGVPIAPRIYCGHPNLASPRPRELVKS